MPHSLMNDEAEQILQAQNYVWGFTRQPPLYSWIVKTFSLILPLNLFTLTVVKYLLSFVFYYFSYRCARLVLNPLNSFLATSSVLFFITYSYDFNRDLTHSILSCALAALSYFLYLKIVDKNSSLYYLALGFSFALGILAKYNFVFFILVLIFSSLLYQRGRQILFSWKSLGAIVISLVTLSPHLLWLKSNSYKSLSYVMSRGEPSSGFTLSSLWNFLSQSYMEVFIVLLLLFLLWRSNLNFQAVHDFKIKAIRISATLALVMPLLLFLFFSFSNFPSKWLAPLYFILLISFFTYVEEVQEKQLSYKLHKAILLVIILVNLTVAALGAFLPGLVGKVRKTQYPYTAIVEKLELGLSHYQDEDLCFIVVEDFVLQGNLTLELPKHFDAYSLMTVKEYLKDPVDKKTIVLLWDSNRKKYPKKFRKNFPEAIKQETIVANYINLSSDDAELKYKLAWAIYDKQARS